ncbi:hypothetical protein [Luteolibacter luteus]|uniref:Uncharacterized protein n=1 Tax=Luteolibacter luteus TaxID=2728835 RepID=A0A858RD51_9BACT|nr:hypothetical protein [Luteolibacter luteus]QJE94534.1 hypothetical protein HHL09_01625 [Luteolibacter luteus]
MAPPPRQQWPDVILTIAAKGRLLPGAGGRIGEAGDAATGYASARPLPIWCVLEERSHPGSARFAEQAFERALHLAAEHGCVSIGVLVDPRKAKLMPVEEVTETALRVFRELSGKHPFRSIHFLPADSFIP